ncbi:hypothetical protein [Skermania piniformis]|uniref:DUF559 domain-containing protein n=1 Tax=Skermania pinensis TaxID=39122 RepID=A0ABX8S4Q0_9ACTN|nr:hypothetical protein [Skermania piniformis]QXQ12802.1 hypothetical protein KV203_12780 [Skermania piniformis]
MGVGNEPFPGSWAIASGALTRWELRHDYRRILPDVYVRRGVVLDAAGRAKAASHWAKGQGVLVGLSAAALHGCRWLDPEASAEITLPTPRHAPAGIVSRRELIADHEMCWIDGFRVTNAARTGFDLGRRHDRIPAVILLDALCGATGTDPAQIAALADRRRGARGVRRLRELLDLVDGGAESPQETRTRLMLIDDGLPRPTTQIRIRDTTGRVVARADLGWEPWRVAVEYDGAHHWNDAAQRAWDIERAELVRELGWRMVRVSSAQLRTRPWMICDRVRAALAASGAPTEH